MGYSIFFVDKTGATYPVDAENRNSFVLYQALGKNDFLTCIGSEP